MGFRSAPTRAINTPIIPKLSCVISVGRTHQTIFNLARDTIAGLIAPRLDIIDDMSFAKVALGVDKEYSRVNFAMLWRLMRISNTLALTTLMRTDLRLVFADFMLVEGTQSSASEFGVVLPPRARSVNLGLEMTQLRPFSHVVFSRRKRSLQRRSRRRVASLRVGRILNVSPR